MRQSIALALLLWIVVRAAAIYAYRRWWAVDTRGRVGQDVRYW